MPHDATPLFISDVSQFAKSLRNSLPDETPGHLSLLNLIAKAAGFQNFSHLKSASVPQSDVTHPKTTLRALRVFNAVGQMKHWPANTKMQGLCLWVIWARLPDDMILSEKQVNAVTNDGHLFNDQAIMRRAMIENHLLTRTKDGRIYQKIARTPPKDAAALIAQIPRRGRP